MLVEHLALAALVIPTTAHDPDGPCQPVPAHPQIDIDALPYTRRTAIVRESQRYTQRHVPAAVCEERGRHKHGQRHDRHQSMVAFGWCKSVNFACVFLFFWGFRRMVGATAEEGLTTRTSWTSAGPRGWSTCPRRRVCFARSCTCCPGTTSSSR